MKLMRMLVMLLLYSASTICSEDKIIEAIEGSSPDQLQSLLIPGFLIRLEDKKRYVALAQEVTNTTHAQLHKFSMSDIISAAKSLTYTVASGAFTLASVIMFAPEVTPKDFRNYVGKGFAKLRLYTYSPQVDAEGRLTEVSAPATKDQYVSAGLACFACYFAGKSLGNTKDILTRNARKIRHQNALAVEAILQRLPAFDNGCFVPGSLS